MPSLPSPPAPSRVYEVYFYVAGGRRLFLRNPNHGVTLDDGNIAWTSCGAARVQSLASVAAVHLQTAALGSADTVIDQCRIDFTGGPAITVSNAAASGMPCARQTAIYREFLRDLHARLAAQGAGAVRFTAGMARWRYKLLFAALLACGLLFIAAPIGLVIATGDWRLLTALAMGVSLCWPFTRLMINNAPRDYTPDRLPDELLS